MLHRRLLLLLGLGLAACTVTAAAQSARTAPQPLKTPGPEYPAALIDSGRDGTAIISFTVAADGSVQDASVKSADDPAFGEAALAALRQWTFKPATRDGQPVAIKVNQPFKFTAPADQKINAIFGRKVFRELPEPAIAASAYRGSLAPLNQPPVRYPPNVAGSGEPRTVEVAFVVGPDGRTLNPTVLGEVPPEFAASAVMHVAALVFEPAMKDGQPVYVETVRQVEFVPPAPPAPPPAPQP